jgi:ketosteroid isomerase-like protein
VTSVLPALFAANGFLVAPGPISSRGPASVAHILARDSLNASSRLRVQTIGGDVSRDGNDGFTYGYFDTFPPRGADTVALLKEIMATDVAFSDSAATSVAAAFGAFAADDAAKSGKESAFVYGKAAVAQLYDPPPPNGLKWNPETGTASRSGDFGFTVGSASARVVDPSAPPQNPATAGHYFTIWRRDATGRWRWVID